MTDPVLSLPDGLRDDLKEPLGDIYTDSEALLTDADVPGGGGPIVAVGDVVTYHLLHAGHPPDVALVDERTERAPVDDDIASILDAARDRTFSHVVEVDNPPATLTEGLLRALAAAVEHAPETTMIVVEGEEDLAALPAVLALPDRASVVYGQPGEGMVLVTVDDTTRERTESLFERMNGDAGHAMELLTP